MQLSHDNASCEALLVLQIAKMQQQQQQQQAFQLQQPVLGHMVSDSAVMGLTDSV